MAPPSSWKDFFNAALMEFDPQKLPDRIQQARDAIMERVDQLLNDPERQPEHDEILHALNTLDELAAIGRGKRTGTDG
jgi:hypothetical protein